MADASSTDQILNAIKKLPGQIAGGPVDVSNLLLGLATGKGLQGFVKEPIGGSDSINKKFGLGDSKGSVEDITSLLTGLISPGGAAKTAVAGTAAVGSLLALMSGAEKGAKIARGAERGVIVPAQHVKSFKEFNKANKAAKTATAEELWKSHQAFKVPTDDILRAVVSDEKAALKPAASIKKEQSIFNSEGPTVNISLDLFHPEKLSDILEHPELFKVMPDLANIKVGAEFGGYKSASYSPDTDTIRMGMQTSPSEFLETLMHEVQHAIQTRGNMTPGASTAAFIKDAEGVKKTKEALNDLLTEATKRFENATKGLSTKEAKATSEYQTLERVKNVEKIVGDLELQAYRAYLKSGGESEARAVEAMLRDRDWSSLPTKKYEYFNELIDPRTASPVDIDPVIRGIIQHLTGTVPKP